MDFVLKLLTGIGVAIGCGFNPYLPLLVISVAGVGNKYHLAAPYDTLGSWPVIIVLAILLGVDIFAGKFPQIEKLYTNLNYLVRPIAGALSFAAVVPDRQLNSGLSFVLGLLLGGVTYVVQERWRQALVVRSQSARLLEPLFSTGENVLSGLLALLTLLLPIVGGPLAILLLAGMSWWLVNLRRKAMLTTSSQQTPEQTPEQALPLTKIP